MLSNFHQPFSILRCMTLIYIFLLITSCQTIEEQSKTDDIIDAQIKIAASQLNRGSPEEAIHTLLPMYKKFENNPKINTFLGLAYLSLKDNSKAVELFRHAYNLEPTTAAGLNLSSGLIASGMYKKARNVLKALIDKDDKEYKEKERIYHNLGYTHEMNGQINLAIKYYDDALRINPRFYLSNFQLAKLYKNSRQFDLSLKHLEKASTSCSLCYESTHMLATEYINRSLFEKANKVLKQFIEQENVVAEDKSSAENLLKMSKNLSHKNNNVGINQYKNPNSKKL